MIEAGKGKVTKHGGKKYKILSRYLNEYLCFVNKDLYQLLVCWDIFWINPLGLQLMSLSYLAIGRTSFFIPNSFTTGALCTSGHQNISSMACPPFHLPLVTALCTCQTQKWGWSHIVLLYILCITSGCTIPIHPLALPLLLWRSWGVVAVADPSWHWTGRSPFNQTKMPFGVNCI